MNFHSAGRGFLIILSVLWTLAAAASAQDFDKVEIQTVKVAESIYMLVGAGGNIGVCVGQDGVFLIDDQFAPLNSRIMSAIAELSDKKVKFLINTHWHADHTGGNELVGETGAVIVAHENVRKRLSAKQFVALFNRTVEPLSKAGLPVVTFADAVTFHFNNQEIEVFHVNPAHTDGDAVVYFKDKNVMHTGDLLFSGRYPIIDLSSGGSVDGMIKAADRLLGMVDDNTLLIPGHGALADKKKLAEFREMLSTVRDRVRSGVNKGMGPDEIIESKPTADFDRDWAGSFPAEKFVKVVYEDITK